jgi:hypothetical protein
MYPDNDAAAPRSSPQKGLNMKIKKCVVFVHAMLLDHKKKFFSIIYTTPYQK